MTIRISKLIGTVLHAAGGLILTGILAAGLFLCLKPAGYRGYAVTSGSMAPAIPVGSCILVKEIPPEQIKAGQIISFTLLREDLTVTHRVVENDHSGKTFRTKGDANAAPDIHTVPYENVVGTVRLAIPLAGYLLVFLSGIRGKLAAFSLFTVLFSLSAWLENRPADKGQKQIRASERRKHV